MLNNVPRVSCKTTVYRIYPASEIIYFFHWMKLKKGEKMWEKKDFKKVISERYREEWGKVTDMR